MIESVPLRLAAFGVGVLAAFGAAFGIGQAIGPLGERPGPPSSPPSTTTTHPVDHREMGS